MPWWKRRKAGTATQATCVGIAVDADRLALVARQGEVEGRTRIVAWVATEASTAEERRQAVRRFVAEHGLAGWPTRIMLPSEDYSLHLVERPSNVPEEELAEATRWLIRDLIAFDVETAAIAILPMPEDAGRMRTPRMFVVAARRESVTELAGLAEEAGLALDGFDVLESALLGLERRMPEAVGATALLQPGDKGSVLTLSHAGHLFLARSLHVDVPGTEAAIDRAIGVADPADAEVLEQIDPLLLDVQRSLDYYESEYGQAPASRLVLLPGALDLAPLAPSLSEALRPLQVEPYECDRFFDFEAVPPSRQLPSILLAAGAAVAGGTGLGSTLVPVERRAGEGGFGLAVVARIAAVVALALGVQAGLSRLEVRTQRDRLATLEGERDRLAASLDSLQAPTSVEPGVDPRIELEALRARRDRDLAMLRDVERGSAGDGPTFSTLLTGLARQGVEGLWLTRIEFARGGAHIALEGRTLDAEDVPRFLRRLGSEPAYDERRFQRLEIERLDETGPGLAFRLATDRDPTSGEGAER